MQKEICSKLALSMISDVLNKSDFSSVPDNIDWLEFKKFCDRHCVSNLLAYCSCFDSDNIPTEIKAYFKDIIFQSVAKEARVEIETQLILDEFENKSISHLLLKGAVIKNFYPQPDMRSMSDVDILVGNQLDEAKEIMSANGFQLKERANLHDCYFKKPFLNFEIHSSLFDEELNQLYEYFQTGFEKSQPVDGYNSRYQLSDEDFYIFMLTHMAKHFKSTGTGLRDVVDIYVYIKSHRELNFDYIYHELEKIGILKFSKHIESIADKWFSHKMVSFNDPVEEYILSCSVHGSFMNLELNRFLQRSTDSNYKKEKFKYYLSVVFPDIAYMKARYHMLEKLPFLLPFYWIKRIVYTLFKSSGSIVFRFGGFAEADETARDKFSDFN